MLQARGWQGLNALLKEEKRVKELLELLDLLPVKTEGIRHGQ
jgi:hypothetical protein